MKRKLALLLPDILKTLHFPTFPTPYNVVNKLQTAQRCYLHFYKVELTINLAFFQLFNK